MTGFGQLDTSAVPVGTPGGNLNVDQVMNALNSLPLNLSTPGPDIAAEQLNYAANSGNSLGFSLANVPTWLWITAAFVGLWAVAKK